MATDEATSERALRPLLALNFFMADMQAGIGPFLGVFLLAHGWQSGWIGTVMTAGGVVGIRPACAARPGFNETTSSPAAGIA